jgi:hypothetical protein
VDYRQRRSEYEREKRASVHENPGKKKSKAKLESIVSTRKKHMRGAHERRLARLKVEFDEGLRQRVGKSCTDC